MMLHIFLRNDFGRRRFSGNSAFNRQFGGFIIPVLDFIVILGFPVNENTDADKHIAGFFHRYYAFLDTINHSFSHASLRGPEHLRRLFLVLDFNFVEHDRIRLSHKIWGDQSQ